MGSTLSKMAEAVEDDVVQATMVESGLEGVTSLLRFPRRVISSYSFFFGLKWPISPNPLEFTKGTP